MNWIFQFGALLIFSGVLAQAQEYILQVPPERFSEILSKYRLRLIDKIPNQDVYRVAGTAGLRLQDDDDGDQGLSLEPNRVVVLPELNGNPSRLIRSRTVAQAAANNRTTSYHGDTVLAAYSSQAAMATVRVRDVHSSLAQGTGVVAVIDTGVDPSHPALRRHLVTGYDFVRNRSGLPNEMDDLTPAQESILNPYTTAILESIADVNPYTTAILENSAAAQLTSSTLPRGFGHGTMVAGIVRLFAPRAKIMPLKAFGGDGRGTLFNIVRAVYHAHQEGARVINMSLSFQTPSPALEDAIDFVSEQRVVCVASVGNRGIDATIYPAAYKRVTGVASVDRFNRQSIFTNHGDNITTVAAPGEAVITAFPGGRYAAGWGTSFAAPIVSGGVSLMIQVKPGLGWEWAQAALSEATSVDGNLGSGLVDLWRAVSKAAQF